MNRRHIFHNCSYDILESTAILSLHALREEHFIILHLNLKVMTVFIKPRHKLHLKNKISFSIKTNLTKASCSSKYYVRSLSPYKSTGYKQHVEITRERLPAIHLTEHTSLSILHPPLNQKREKILTPCLLQ